MAYEIQRALEKLNSEIQKDQEQAEQYKQKLIQEIKSLDRSKMFIPPPKKKTSFFKKILIAFGYGEKGRNI
jgi:cell division protein FtsL